MLFDKFLWPTGDAPDLVSGLSDSELEDLCVRKLPLSTALLRRRKLSIWSSEIYGHGRAWRSLTNWPNFLPLPISSDHGVTFGQPFEDHEKKNISRIHLTWSRWRQEKVLPGKRVIRVQHPWVAFRRFHQIEKSRHANGTLEFVDHSVPGELEMKGSLDRYLTSLESRPDFLRPTALVIHPNDVKEGIHYRLRPLGLPIFTFGNPLHPNYVDRFYCLVRNFENVSSASIGSHTFFAEELGVRAYVYGEGRRFLWNEPPSENTIERVEQVFRQGKSEDRSSRIALLDEFLGTDFVTHEQKSFVRRIFLFQLAGYLMRWGGKTFFKLVRQANRRFDWGENYRHIFTDRRRKRLSRSTRGLGK